MIRNVMLWLKELGGLDAVEKMNRDKGKIIYGAIDAKPDFFRSPVDKDSRSFMNVVFRLPSEALEEKFVAEAKKAKMIGLKGHRSVGGIRASIYNAVPVEAVSALANFMNDFAKANG
jgi:phosphoserine aminotransferase